jgi:hypothetical protein
MRISPLQARQSRLLSTKLLEAFRPGLFPIVSTQFLWTVYFFHHGFQGQRYDPVEPAPSEYHQPPPCSPAEST